MSTLLSAFFMTHMYLSQSSDNENRSPYHLTSDNLCRISPPGGYTDLQWRPLTSVIANHPVLVKHFRHIEGEGRVSQLISISIALYIPYNHWLHS